MSVQAIEPLEVLFIPIQSKLSRCTKLCMAHEQLLGNLFDSIAERELELHDRNDCLIMPDAPDERQLTPPSDILYMEELNEHFNKVFPNRETGVFHELISDIVHIDVNIMEATPDEPYRVLYTNGMSDLPMTLPQEIRKEYKHLERSELMMFLPADWPLTQKDFEAEENYWPIRLMKMLARFPHMNWLPSCLGCPVISTF